MGACIQAGSSRRRRGIPASAYPSRTSPFIKPPSHWHTHTHKHTHTHTHSFLPFHTPFPLRSQDPIYVLSSSIIILNTSLHTPIVRDKPSVERFITMNRGINEGGDLPEDLLRVSGWGWGCGCVCACACARGGV